MDEFETAWDEVAQEGRIFLYDSFGINDWESIRSKIRYLRDAEGVRYFFLDHLTALAAWQEDERKALEVIMAELGSLVKEIPIWILFVSHLATPEGKPHEEGGRVTIRHFKGSRAIGFWTHFMFGMERDQQAENHAVRTTTVLRCLKDRYTGTSTGKVGYLGYDPATGLQFVTTAPDQDAESYGFEPDEDFSGETSNDF
jgi:twinkle protein